MRRWGSVLAVMIAVACGSSGGGGNGFNTDGGSSGGSSGAGSDSGGGSGGGSGSGGSSGGFLGGDGSVSDAQGNCTAPDMLIVLDHTDSMSAEPTGKKPPNTMAGHMLSKWYLATQAIKAVVAPPSDTKISFGLELFPLDPQTVDAGAGMGSCMTLSQLLAGMASTNKQCQPAEVPIPPASGTGMAITNLLDPETLRLCVSTPIALALGTARAELQSIAHGVAQYVLLVTDGGETCKGDVTGVAQQLATAGIKTFVVGFGGVTGGAGGVNVPLLDNVACAGETAQGFPTPCTKGAAGYTATSTTGPPLFYSAQDGASLQTALAAITKSVCCGCAQ